MNATLTFNLPEEEQEHLMAVKAGNMNAVLWDLDQYLRNIIKYEENPEFKKIKGVEAAEKIREKLHELLEDQNVSEFLK